MDETLLELDRAFDSQKIVLLHAFAGSGKTSTAAEFARWYSLTGGVDGPALFTTFERHKPLARVLDKIEQFFGKRLEQFGTHWLTLTDEERRDVALQMLKQVPVLWIWDNVESVAGFPSGTKSDWSPEEQNELSDFLREARDTKAKFLLTSRRDESGWLGDLPTRIEVLPMPMQERVELARAIAERRRRKFVVVKDWTPLLRFTQGNPLTITVLISQVLRDGLKTKKEIEGFVAELQAGTAEIEEDEKEGRSKSLGASLRYGFEHAFNEDELKRLALLHLFQGFVDVNALRAMGDPGAEWSLPEVHGLTMDYWISLLDRAAEVGLLRSHGAGYYSIHPALPWYFRDLFIKRYTSENRADHAFVCAVSSLGDYYWDQYEHGNRDVICVLAAEETNLLNAWRLALGRGWLDLVIGTIQGLRVLYNHTGRRAEWRRLVEEIEPCFVDPETDGPLPGLDLGLEEDWSLVTEYRSQLAKEARQWEVAMRLRSICVDWALRRAANALARSPEELSNVECHFIRTLASSIHELGEIQRLQGLPKCVKSYIEALELVEKIGEKAGASTCAFNLGHAYKNLAEIRDLDQADRWYRRSLKLNDEHDGLSQGRCRGSLGSLAIKRFKEARSARKSSEDQFRHLKDAIQYYRTAQDLFPPNAIYELATTHSALGYIYYYAGDLGQALPHLSKAIRYSDTMGDIYSSALDRYNVASALANANRFSDALLYAQASLRNYETCGESAAADIQDTRELIAKIEKAMKSQG